MHSQETTGISDVQSMGRRKWLLASLFGGIAVQSVWAQTKFPSKPITIYVPFAAGGFSDKVARQLGNQLSEKLGVPVVVDNKPGGSTFIGATTAAKAPPDGHTLFLANISTMAIIPSAYRNPPSRVWDELEPIALAAMSPNVITCNVKLPIHSVMELVAYAKTHDVTFGTPGMGSTGHLAGVLLAKRAGVEIRHIPYKGSPAVLTDVVNGNLQCAVDNLLTWAPPVDAGLVRALAVTGASRSPLLPNIPTMAEAGIPNFISTSWFGLAAPRGTPGEVIARLNAEVNAIVETPAFRSSLKGAEFHVMDASQFKSFIADERQKWGDVARSVDLQID